MVALCVGRRDRAIRIENRHGARGHLARRCGRTWTLWRSRSVVSVLGRIAVVALIGLWAVESIPSLHERVFGGGETQLLGVELNTSGRDVIWGGVIANAERHDVWVGQGAGSATDYVRNDEGPVGVEAAEPHNDYLRIWHDFGYVGLLFWSIAVLTLFRAMWVKGRRSGNPMCYAGNSWFDFGSGAHDHGQRHCVFLRDAATRGHHRLCARGTVGAKWVSFGIGWMIESASRWQ